jgi:ketosteroid isomerase-like protein
LRIPWEVPGERNVVGDEVLFTRHKEESNMSELKKIDRAEIFANLQNNSAGFFEHVDDQVDWTVMGTHPLVGRYHTKEDFIEHTFKRLDKIMRDGIKLTIQHLYNAGDTTIVEFVSTSTTLDGKPFNNTYCWVCRFAHDRIVEVRAYVDSALVQTAIDQNEPHWHEEFSGPW